MVHVGVALGVVAPGIAPLPHLPQLALAVEGNMQPGLPGFGIDDLNRARIRVTGIFGRALDNRHAADLPHVVVEPAVGTAVAHSVVVPLGLDMDRNHVFPAQEVPVPLQRTAGEAVEVFQGMLGAHQRVGFDLGRNPPHAAQARHIGPAVVAPPRVVVAGHNKGRAPHVVGREEAGELLPVHLAGVGNVRQLVVGLWIHGQVRVVGAVVEGAQAALEAPAAAVDLFRIVLPVLGLDRVLVAPPALGRLFGFGRDVLAAKTQPGRQRVIDEVAAPVPAFVIVPGDLQPGLGVVLGDILVGERIATHIVLQGAVLGQAHLFLELFVAVEHQLVGGDVVGLHDLELHIGPFLVLLKVTGEQKRPDSFQVGVGQDIARFEVGLGILGRRQPLAEALPRVGRRIILGHGRSRSEQHTASDKYRCECESPHTSSLGLSVSILALLARQSSRRAKRGDTLPLARTGSVSGPRTRSSGCVPNRRPACGRCRNRFR